jgi:hypothetical protein
MKIFYSIVLAFLISKASAQDIIYPITGDPTPGIIKDIQADKLKFKDPDNPTGPDHSKTLSKLLFAFNSAGTYLVFSDKNSVTGGKDAFIAEVAQPRPFDVLVDTRGVVTDMNIIKETDNDISGTRKGKTIKVAKAALVFLIRKNGTHQLFVSYDKAAPYLLNAKGKITQLFAPAAAPVTSTTAATTGNPAVKLNPGELAPDMALFNKKAVDKTTELSNYLQTICSPSTSRELAVKSIDLAIGLFISEESSVEVSNVKLKTKNKYKIRNYLDRMQRLSNNYDKVDIEYANINYASKFVLGPDGNYYATITFVQKFKGFIDNKVEYGDVTRRNVTVVLKSYQKTDTDGTAKKEWDVFLEDIGVVVTRKG